MFSYTIRQGISNIWKNKLFSMASIATMAACIFLFGVFFSAIMNFSAMLKNAEENVAVTVLFEKDISPQRIAEIGTLISERPEVATYNFVSADDAWDEFSVDYFEGSEDLLQGFANDNPLKNSASYEIYLSDVSLQENLVSYLNSLDGVRKVNESKDVAGMLSDFNRLIATISITIIAILLCAAVFLISNTVSMGITVRKEEIAIMKLIGATDFLVRAPFVVEGIIIGLIGSAIPLAILYFLYQNVVTYILEKFSLLGSLLTFLSVERVFEPLAPVAVFLGVGIGFIGSFVTVKRHLKV